VCIQHTYHKIITEELVAFVNKLALFYKLAEVLEQLCHNVTIIHNVLCFISITVSTVSQHVTGLLSLC